MNNNSILKKIDQFESIELEAVREFKARGGKIVATFCRFFPPSLLFGLGLRPLRILTGTSVSAESAGERLIRSDACSYCKCILGNFLEKKSLHALVDLVVGVITCDQMRRTLERLQYDLKIPVFPIQLPATGSPEAENYYVHNVKRVIRDIAEYSGVKINLDAVRIEEELRRKAAAMLARLNWQGNISPVIIQRLSRLYFTTRPANFLGFLIEHKKELPTFTPAVRIIIVGSVSCEGDDFIFEILNKNQIGMIPLNCTGINALEGSEEIENTADDQLIDTLARSIFRSTPCIRRRPNSLVYDKIEESLIKTSASGIILKTLPFCDLWYTEKERMKRTFNLPTLVLDAGYGEGNQNRLNSRIEAFLETLAC